jgi:hypothetical protein
VDYVGSLFSFSQPLGANYSGAWVDDSVFVVTVLNGTAEGAAPQLGRTSVALVNTTALRNAPNRSSQVSPNPNPNPDP